MTEKACGNQSLDISLVIPVFRCEKFIGDCIDSILSQSYRNLEIILIDDGSPDACGEICDAYAGRDSRIRVIHRPNEGVSAARNIGLRVAHGDYIMFVDGDDWLEENSVEDVVNVCKKLHPDILITDFFTEFENGKTLRDSFFDIEGDVHLFSRDDRRDLVRNCLVVSRYGNRRCSTNVGVPWAKAYKRDFLVEGGYAYKHGLRRMQDTVFNMRCFYDAGLVAYIKRPIYHYRKTSSSATERYDPLFLNVAEQVLAEIDSFMKERNAFWLNDEYLLKMAALFCEWIRVCLIGDSAMPRSDKVMTLRETATGSLFHDGLYECDTKRLSKAQRIAVALTRLHAWHVLYGLCSMHCGLKKSGFVL